MIIMNRFDSYMLNKVRRLKDVRTQYAATGEKALLAGVPAEACLRGGCGYETRSAE